MLADRWNNMDLSVRGLKIASNRKRCMTYRVHHSFFLPFAPSSNAKPLKGAFSH
jgi:hypothetical protein